MTERKRLAVSTNSPAGLACTTDVVYTIVGGKVAYERR
jgi:hypothetical protein